MRITLQLYTNPIFLCFRFGIVVSHLIRNKDSILWRFSFCLAKTIFGIYFNQTHSIHTTKMRNETHERAAWCACRLAGDNCRVIAMKNPFSREKFTVDTTRWWDSLFLAITHTHARILSSSLTAFKSTPTNARTHTLTHIQQQNMDRFSWRRTNTNRPP